jgi:hypothetical protein
MISSAWLELKNHRAAVSQVALGLDMHPLDMGNDATLSKDHTTASLDKVNNPGRPRRHLPSPMSRAVSPNAPKRVRSITAPSRLAVRAKAEVGQRGPGPEQSARNRLSLSAHKSSYFVLGAIVAPP